jgi:hypothetical protein
MPSTRHMRVVVFALFWDEVVSAVRLSWEPASCEPSPSPVTGREKSRPIRAFFSERSRLGLRAVAESNIPRTGVLMASGFGSLIAIALVSRAAGVFMGLFTALVLLFGLLWIVNAPARARQRAEDAAARVRAAETDRELAAAIQARADRELADSAARRANLVARFGERDAGRIMAGEYWQGATVEMMAESLGAPADVRERVYKSKTKATHYYRPISAQRHELKVHYENSVVVGWDD